MLTRLIVASYVWLLETALWLTLAIAGVVGYHSTVPLMNAIGAEVTPEFAWKIVGTLVFLVITFLVLAVLTGPALVLIDLRQAVRSIEAKREGGSAVRASLPFERKEPSI
jgi:hypothetical protein